MRSNKNFHVLVIGGSGFIGNSLVEELLQAGYVVTVYDKFPSLIDGVLFIEGDITNLDSLKIATRGIDFVYHLAGWADMAKSKESPKRVIDLNVIGTTNVLEACVANNVKKVVFASSMYVFSKNGSFYRASKQCCELLIEEYSKAFEIDFCIIRYGSLYGPNATHGNAVYELLKQALSTGNISYWGTGEEVRQYIHVKDAARLSVDLINPDFKENYISLVGIEDIKVSTMLSMINEILGGEIKIELSRDPEIKTHYIITPFNFMPKTGYKLISSKYKDLGQGILECIHHIHNELIKNENSDN